MILKLNDMEIMDDPEADDIEGVLKTLTSQKPKLVLFQEDTRYLEAIYKGPGAYSLKYRERSVEATYVSANSRMNKRKTLRILLSYAEQEEEWKTSVVWEKINVRQVPVSGVISRSWKILLSILVAGILLVFLLWGIIELFLYYYQK